jgi:DNA-binding transcriptional LysR family regulator
MTDEPLWDYYRTFLAVLRTGTLSGAARDLSLTQPTVGRQITALEQSFGGKALFTRSQRGLIPTRAALELKPHADAMAASAAVMRRVVAGGSAMHGAVRVSASTVIGVEVLPQALRTFNVAHPQINIELALSNENADLLRRDADVAVRMVRPSQKALFAKRVGRVWLGFHAHRLYLERHAPPKTMEDLADHALIGFDKLPAYLKNVTLAGRPLTREVFRFRSDDDLAQIAALRAGVGIGACQYGIARRNPDLVPVLTREFSLHFDCWIVMHEDQKKVERVRAMFDHLAAAMSEYCATTGVPKAG